MGSQVSIMKRSFNEQYPDVQFKLEKDGYVKYNGEQAIDALRQMKVPGVTEYQRHPELNDVMVPKGVTSVRALDGVNTYFVLDGKWHKTEKHTGSSLTLKEYHKEYCIKKDNEWVYNV
jgi:hypothetical protein